eukprot:TRINITY_DN16435_c0_g1_i1.p1 TRINITY_DN16435_c0_g1~~TRINITY_DN16435_c0_g1_i1.p1  ORF type:complete len:741 (+),score=225.81 TRINITY_DN16435_c0_g1_i1:90-2312(+)
MPRLMRRGSSFIHENDAHTADSAAEGADDAEARRAWLFRHTGVRQYKHVLNAYRRRDSDPGRWGSFVGRNGSFSSASPTGSPRSRALGAAPGPKRPTADRERSYTAWVGLYDAPLFVSSLGCPLNQVCKVLLQLIAGMQGNAGPEVLNGYLMRMGALIGIACEGTEAIELHIDPQYLSKCKRLSRIATQYGFAQGKFTPLLDLARAEALRGELATEEEDEPQMSTEPFAAAPEAAPDAAPPPRPMKRASTFAQQDILVTNAPEDSFIDRRALTFWETVQADLWELLKPVPFDRKGGYKTTTLVKTVLQLAILFGWCVFYVIRTLPQFYAPRDELALRWRIAEACFEIFFTLDWGVRMVAAPHKRLHAKNLLTQATFVALLPFYIKWTYRFSGGAYVTHTGFIGHVDMITVLRVFKVTSYMGDDLKRMRLVIEASAGMLIIGFVSLVVFVLIISNVLFFIETGSSDYIFDMEEEMWLRTAWPEEVINGTIISANVTSPYQDMFDAFWWCVATVTTVGYGDRYPITTGGRVAAGLCMVVGVLVFAVPASVICSHFTITKADGEVANAGLHRKSAVRGYVRQICRRTLASEPFAPIMLHHFIMLDSVEQEYLKNPLSVDIAGQLYRQLYYLYRAAISKEKCLCEEMELSTLPTRQSTSAASSTSVTSFTDTNSEPDSDCGHSDDDASTDLFPDDTDEQRRTREHIRLYCQWRFANNCAEVFRRDRDKLWGAFADVKRAEANQM